MRRNVPVVQATPRPVEAVAVEVRQRISKDFEHFPIPLRRENTLK